MSSGEPSRIAVPLQEQIATDGNWTQAAREPSETLDVMIHVANGRIDAVRKHAESIGASNLVGSGDVVFGTVHADRITDLATGHGVRKVEERADPIAHSTSEGISTTNADQVHNEGVTGENVTVVIIDQQFNPDQNEIQDQVIDQIGFSDYFRPSTPGLHGTACAEIVAEMLPDADLVLASAVGTSFPNLIDTITAAHEPEVMSMSLGYKPTIRLDGQDYLSKRISEYTQATGGNTSTGGLFAVSAGNEANGSHWDGPVQTDGNGYVEFDDQGTTFFEVTTTASGQLLVVQSDSDWDSNQDYIVELYDSNQNHLQTFTKTTTPAQELSMPDSATSYIKIQNDGLSASNHLDLFAWGNYIEFPTYTAERSLGIPATSADSETLTTAAVEHSFDTLEGFSSRGPTQDGRRGVDISGPDGTQSDTYGDDPDYFGDEFYGTSAACPHVAGASGLLMDLTGLSNVDARESLFGTARDINDTSVDPPINSDIGHGYVDVKAAYDSLIASVSATGDEISAGGEATISISGSEIGEIVLEDLWTDWSLVSTQTDGGTFTDNALVKHIVDFQRAASRACLSASSPGFL